MVKPCTVIREVVYEYLKSHDRPIHLSEIYNEIKAKLLEICDDLVRCEHKGVDYGQPEWKHRVRAALQVLKRQSLVEPLGKGYWNSLKERSFHDIIG